MRNTYRAFLLLLYR